MALAAGKQDGNSLAVNGTPASARVRVRRGAHKGRYNDAAVAAALARGLVAHIAFVDGDQPFCIPMLYAHIGNRLYVHGSRASRVMRCLGAGIPACVAVTIVDGLVLARSAFEHSANYSSVIALGGFVRVDDEDEMLGVLEAFTNKLLPGRWAEVRGPTKKELKATAIASLDLDEASVKLRIGPPDDDHSSDAALPVWAGVVPMETHYGEPVASPGLSPGIVLSPSVRGLKGRSRG